jgi:hypothetical protein
MIDASGPLRAVCPLSTAVPSGAVGLSVIRIRPPFFKTECSNCTAHKRNFVPPKKLKIRKQNRAVVVIPEPVLGAGLKTPRRGYGC